MNGLRAG